MPPMRSEIAPPMGELYANPSASQAMLDDAQFDVEQWLSGTEKTRYSRRVDRISERIEDWTGKLNPAQRKRVQDIIAKIQDEEIK